MIKQDICQSCCGLVSFTFFGSFQAEEPFVSDEGRVSVIFNNLFSNAMLFRAKSHEPYIDIDIETSLTQAIITIQDNGIGIRDEARPRIFDMFYRGTEESQGAGLIAFDEISRAFSLAPGKVCQDR